VALYIITDGKGRYMKKDYQNHYAITSSEALADKLPRNIADKVFKNYIPKTLRKDFHLELYETESQKEDKKKCGIKLVKQEDINGETKSIDKPHIKRWVDKVQSLNGLADEATTRRDELNRRLKQLDLITPDVAHYVENSKPNAAQMCKFFKMWQKKLRERREIKDELMILDFILDNQIKNTLEDDLNKVVSGMDNRKYEPRVWTELFDIK